MAGQLSTERFSNRVEDYVRYRPQYPAAVLEVLVEETGWQPSWTIADIGAGTGISAEMFLKHGNEVIAIEPNAPMREAADRLLAGYPKFRSVAGTAEATTLADGSVDAVTAAQAFHWFDPPRAGDECRRILRPGGWGVLLWNTRRHHTSEFLRDYEAVLKRFETDRVRVHHESVDESRVDQFFGAGKWRKRTVDNEQRLTLAGLQGRAKSSSYLPADGDPAQPAMLAELEALFNQHQQGGIVVIEYDTEIYVGRMR